MSGGSENAPLGKEELERLLHRLSNLVSTIYAFGEPARATGEGTDEALEEILAAGARLEEVLKDLKQALRGDRRP